MQTPDKPNRLSVPGPRGNVQGASAVKHNSGMRARRWAVGLTAGALIFGCLYFVWPTPYEVSHSGDIFWRVNRFTGVRERSTDQGWKSDLAIRAEANRESDTLMAVLAKPRKLGTYEFEVQSTKLSVSCRTRYANGLAEAQLLITGPLNSREILLEASKPSQSVTLLFWDTDRFEVARTTVKFADMAWYTSRGGKTIEAGITAKIAIDPVSYQRISQFAPAEL